MTDDKTTGTDKTISLSTKTLSLKRPVEQGVVRQSFSHGRSKAVVVETVKRRIGPGGEVIRTATPAPPVVATPIAPPVRAYAAKPTAPQRPTGVVLRTLTADEQNARAMAVADSMQRDEEDRARQEAEAKIRNERAEREASEREASELRKHEEDERRRVEDQVKRRAEEESRRRASGEPAPVGVKTGVGPRLFKEQAAAKVSSKEPPRDAAKSTSVKFASPRGDGQMRDLNAMGRKAPVKVEAEKAEEPKPTTQRTAATTTRTITPAAPRGIMPDDDDRPRRTGLIKAAPARPERTKPGQEKIRGRLTVVNATAGGDEERTRSVASFKRRVQRLKGGPAEVKEKVMREVTIPETITIQELANRMSERAVDVIRLLMKQGGMHKISDVIDADTAQIIAEDMGHTVKRVAESDVEDGLFDAPDTDENLVYRPPVVTIMGHVDHGKTSLLDAIRQTNVVSGEAGGITQHIGAYQVTSPLGGKITFIDTPGHAAFTAMRARGAKVTDIVVLVVAADDGVMPQTIEAINHAKAAKVPLIVAVNKIDKPDAKPERVRNELLQYDVQVEDLGGDTQEIMVSAKQRTNLDKLLEAIQLQAEVLELKANPSRAAEGSVVEAKLDKGRGPVATVLVQRGTLRQGDIVVAGVEWGRVRALINDKGAHVSEAGPSLPVEVLGFNGAPEAGDRVAVVENEAKAREITAYRISQKRDKAAAASFGTGRSLADMMTQLKSAGKKEFPIVIKGDVQGSVEAIIGSLDKLGTDEVMARVLHSGVGGVSESDVTLANASGCSILAFNVRAHKEAREAAARLGVEIRYYSIIYDLVDDIKLAMSGLLAPTLREDMLGNALIQEVFNITKVGKVAGCRITDGKVERGANVRLIRDNVVIHEGKLSTLKRFKDEVKEVQSGQDCGMAFEKYEDMRAGDVIECFKVVEVKRSL
jgi:translation initiation factor IF-2